MCQLLFSGPVPPAEQLKAVLSQPPGPDCPPLVATVCWAALPVAQSRKASLAALDFLKEMYEVSGWMGLACWWAGFTLHVGFPEGNARDKSVVGSRVSVDELHSQRWIS